MKREEINRAKEEKRVLIAKMIEDPTYLEKLTGNDEILEHMKKAEEEYMLHAAPLFAELARAGFPLQSLSELYHKRSYYTKDTYRQVMPILFYWLPIINELRIKETIVRALTVRWAKPEAASILISEFTNVEDPKGFYKWAIGNALSVVADDSVFDDIVKLVKDKQHRRAREMVAVALGNMKNPQAVDVLIDLLQDEEVAGHALIALRKLRPLKARPYIEPFLNHPTTWVRKEAQKAIEKIDKANQ